MKVMVMVKATQGSEAGVMPTEQLMADMTAFNQELIAAGIMRAGEGLKPTSEGLRVRFSGTNRTVTKGPFPETNELVAGFWLWEVDSVDHALEWVKRCPNPMFEDSDIEIRPLYGMEDFACADPDGSMREKEANLRETLALRDATVHPYVFFGGRCEEALAFYESALGARLGVKMRFRESPDPAPEGCVPAGFEDKIMHAEFTVGKTTLMVSDGCEVTDGPDRFRLSLNLTSAEDAARVFTALSAEGQVVLPLGPTFFSPAFGMVTDKFGIGWMVHVPAAPPPSA